MVKKKSDNNNNNNNSDITSNSDINTEIKNNKNKKRKKNELENNKNNKNKKQKKKEIDNNENNNENSSEEQSFTDRILSLIFPKYINVECTDLDESFKQDDEIKKNILISSEKFDRKQLFSLLSLNEFSKYKLPVLLNDNDIFLETMTLCKRFITESNCLEGISAILNADKETSKYIPCLYDNAMLTLLKLRDCINELQYRKMIPKKLECLWNITKDEELSEELVQQQEETKEHNDSSEGNDEYSRSKE